MDRLGEPEDIAETFAFLADPARWINGQTLFTQRRHGLTADSSARTGAALQPGAETPIPLIPVHSLRGGSTGPRITSTGPFGTGSMTSQRAKPAPGWAAVHRGEHPRRDQPSTQVLPEPSTAGPRRLPNRVPQADAPWGEPP